MGVRLPTSHTCPSLPPSLRRGRLHVTSVALGLQPFFPHFLERTAAGSDLQLGVAWKCIHFHFLFLHSFTEDRIDQGLRTHRR